MMEAAPIPSLGPPATAPIAAAAKDGLPTSYEGATTIYELFNNAVEKYGKEK